MAVSVNESVGFPLDSDVVGIGSNGLPVYSNQYTSADYRNVLSKFFKNGVFSNSALMVGPKPPGNTNVAQVIVTSGSAVVNGAIFTLKDTLVQNVSVPHTSVDGAEYVGFSVVVRLDTRNSNETMELKILAGEPTRNDKAIPYPEIVRSGGIYDILLARFSFGLSYISTTGHYSGFFNGYEDTRLIPEFCGLATPYVQFDTTAFSQELDYIVEETDIRAKELLAQANSSADAAIDNLNEKTETAVQLAADALDETVAGSIYNRLEDLETDVRPIELGGTDSDTPLGASLTMSFPSLAYAKKIPVNADLDDYGAIGSFGTQSSADVATMHNVPDGVTSAFRLYVADLTGIEYMDLWRQQFLIEYNTLNIYARHNNPNTHFWSGWIRYAKESDVPTIKQVEIVVPPQSWEAGAIGSRAAQYSISIGQLVEGQYIIGAIVTFAYASSAYNPTTLLSSGNLYVNFYRASSSAYGGSTTGTEVKVRVTYYDKSNLG